MSEINQILPEPCNKCKGAIDKLRETNLAVKALKKVPDFPSGLTQYRSAMVSSVTSNLAQAKREVGWTLGRNGESCDRIVDNQCSLLRLVIDGALTDTEIEITGVSDLVSDVRYWEKANNDNDNIDKQAAFKE